MTPDRGHTAIAISGRRSDNLIHVEIVDHREGTGWVPERIAALVKKHSIATVRCDGIAPAASLINDLAAEGVTVTTMNTSEVVQGCGEFYDAAHQNKLRQLGTPELQSAVTNAATRNLGEAWAWARKTSTVDISPLVTCTLAAWASAPIATNEGPFAYA